MKLYAKILLGIVVTTLVVMALLVALVNGYDWDKARPWINQKASEATGRELVIAGHLHAHWARPETLQGWRSLIPWPTFIANDVHIGNPSWAKRPVFASVGSIELVVEILPLLTRTLVIPSIKLTNPAIDIERTLDGKNNWTFAPASSSESTWKVQLQDLVFADGTVDVSDQPTRIEMRTTVTTLGKPVALGDLLARKATATPANPAPADPAAPAAPAAPSASSAPTPPGAGSVDGDGRYGFGLRFDGTYRGAKLTGAGKIGGVLALMDAARPFPLEADVHLGDNHMVVAGTLTDPAKLAAVDMRLTLAAKSMADLFDLLGVALPETPPFRTSGHLTGHFSKLGSQFRYADFSGEVGHSDLAGTVDFSTAPPRPRLSGHVSSKRLALADLGPVVGKRPTGKPGTVAPAVHAARRDRALPDTPFRTDRWRAMDADLTFRGASILRPASLPLSDMSTHVVITDGVLHLDPLTFGVAGGTVSGTIVLDGRREPLDGKFDLALRHLKLKQLFPTFQPMNASFGEINGDARLAARGNSPAALAASANGELKMLVNDGAISNTLLEEAGLNVANIVVAKLFGDRVVSINCAAADFVVKNGLLDAQVFALDTTDALINVDGTINLANEQLNLNVHPQTKGVRIFSLRSPLYVRGTFKQPDVGVMKGPLVTRGAAALALGALNPFASLLALLVPSNHAASPCPAIVATARAGLKGKPAISSAERETEGASRPH